MTWIWGKTGLTWFFYVPSFIAGTLIGGSLAFLLLKHLQKTKMLSVFQEALGSRAYEGGNTVANDAIGIAFLGLIAALAVSVAVKQLVKAPGILASNLKYLVLAAFVAAAGIYWIKKQKKTGEYS